MRFCHFKKRYNFSPRGTGGTLPTSPTRGSTPPPPPPPPPPPVRGTGGIIILRANTKGEALTATNNLPPNIQASVRRFFKKSSNTYNDYRVEILENGNVSVRMTKPGNVPGSRAVYHKEIDAAGNTIRTFKVTYDSSGNVIHVKDK